MTETPARRPAHARPRMHAYGMRAAWRPAPIIAISMCIYIYMCNNDWGDGPEAGSRGVRRRDTPHSDSLTLPRWPRATRDHLSESLTRHRQSHDTHPPPARDRRGRDSPPPHALAHCPHTPHTQSTSRRHTDKAYADDGHVTATAQRDTLGIRLRHARRTHDARLGPRTGQRPRPTATRATADGVTHTPTPPRVHTAT
jgi:hypothetical protein